MNDSICDDNRFEIIEAAKQRLIEATNIEMRPDEMAVLDSILFRMWQMGWLPEQNEPVEIDEIGRCTKCNMHITALTHYRIVGCEDGNKAAWYTPNFCPSCGAKVVGR